jgi:DNA-directed RNA polymerase subunit RPC12/RpoP
VKRHLFYNTCAFAKSVEWKRNINELAPYLNLFDGRKLVVIRTGDGIVPPDEVESFFPQGDYEFHRLPNNPRLGEVEGFIDLLETFLPAADNEALFYAHTKGVRYLCEPHNMLAIWRWRQVMLRECLSDIRRIEDILKEKVCCGTYFSDIRIAESRFLPLKKPVDRAIPWHYSGTFWWVKLKQLFDRPGWRKIPQNYLGVENYLCEHVHQNDAGRIGAPRGILYKVMWPYTCSTCVKTFSLETYNNSKARPPCPHCKKPLQPAPCEYTENVIDDYEYVPVPTADPKNLSRGFMPIPGSVCVSQKTTIP